MLFKFRIMDSLSDTVQLMLRFLLVFLMGFGLGRTKIISSNTELEFEDRDGGVEAALVVTVREAGGDCKLELYPSLSSLAWNAIDRG